MSRAVSLSLAAGCLLVLTFACFGPVLFLDRQFSYRDSGEFYYPLYQRVQQEWEAGRWPLWEPEENGGMPLLGNPSAAVLYPGKVLYALPYAWGARLYVIAHVHLAFLAMLALLRSWGMSWGGSGLGALAYAFGAPVLSQYCNVIFLVGAAWAPLGLLAVDRLVRLKRRRAWVELAVVLALQMLGGDPEAAYLVLLCGGLYTIVLAARGDRATGEEGHEGGDRPRAWWLVIGVTLAFSVWAGITLAAAAIIKAGRAQAPIDAESSGATAHQVMLLIGWGLAAALLWFWSRDRVEMRGSIRSLLTLAGSAVLALALGAAQFLPVLEFSGLSTRGARAEAEEMYAFSVEPGRVVEFVWPGFFGSFQQAERSWLHLVPPRHVARPWVPSLYLGGLCVVLALNGAGFRGGPPWRPWLTVIAAVSFLGALGEFSSPVWWARAIPGMPPLLGAHDPLINEPPRTDGGVADGFGSPYGLLATLLPGFRLFRYPGKLLIFTSLALSALAAVGWDRWRVGHSGRAPKVLLVLSLGALAVVFAMDKPLVRLLDAAGRADSPTASFDARGAMDDLRRSLGHGAIVMASAVALASSARRRSRWAAPAALIVLSADLAVAVGPLMITVPQSLFDREAKLARLIEEAERRDPSPGPYRIHRMPHWYPAGMFQDPTRDIHQRVTRWEYDTLKPKYALLADRLAYTLSANTLVLDDYGLFFGGFFRPLDTRRATLRGAEEGQPILCYTRRGYDLWGTRYFVLPFDPAGWQDGSRGFASFLPDTEMIAPDPSLLESHTDPKALEAWGRDQDWQLLRNRAAYPRAWVVHSLRTRKPIASDRPDDLERLMGQILYNQDALWFEPRRPVFDPHTFAWIETDDPRSLARYSEGVPADAVESVTIARHEPQRVEIEAHLASPGIVILADVYYPGWTLTIDGRPSPILRANRLMRGAAVEAGVHRLVYTYSPLSFRLGGVLSLASIVLSVVFVLRIREKSGEPE